MKVIKKISKFINEELDMAECYVDFALKIKDEFPNLYDKYIKLAEQELEHTKENHNIVVNIINEQKKNDIVIPLGMKEAYDFIHEIQMNKYYIIKNKIL